MSTITQTISEYSGDTPDKVDMTVEEFDEAAEDWVDYQTALAPQFNTFAVQANLLAGAVNTYKSDAQTAASNALSYKNASETARNYSSEWASKSASSGTVDDSVNTPDYSAKSYAVDDLTGANGGSAKDWAQTDEDTEVITGEYSAKHWAQKAAKGERLTATSASSVTIGTGTKTFTLVESYRAFIAGTQVRISETADPSTNYMHGTVTSYNDATDELVVSVSSVSGSGTISAWSIGMFASGDANTLAGNTLAEVRAGTTATDVGLENVPNKDATDMDNWGQKSATDGQVPVWNNSESKWEPGDIELPSEESWEVFTSSTSYTVPEGITTLRIYAFGAGGNGVSSSSGSPRGGGGGGCAYGDITVSPGNSVSINISSGISTVSYDGTTLLTANPGADGVLNVTSTGGTATKHASVANGGAYSGGSTSYFGGASSGSPLGAGASSGSLGGSGWGGGGSRGGGGVGGSASNNMGGGSGGSAGGGPGKGRDKFNRFSDPLLEHLDSPGGAGVLFDADLSSNRYMVTGLHAGPGGGGGGGECSGGMSGELSGGDGGFGGGGGGTIWGNSSMYSGDGGFGGGGGGSQCGGSSGYPYPGDGGYGGGGGASDKTNIGYGGPAIVLIYIGD